MNGEVTDLPCGRVRAVEAGAAPTPAAMQVCQSSTASASTATTGCLPSRHRSGAGAPENGLITSGWSAGSGNRVPPVAVSGRPMGVTRLPRTHSRTERDDAGVRTRDDLGRLVQAAEQHL